MTPNMEREKTWPSALMLVLLGIGVIALIALVVYALMMPGVLESILNIAIIVIIAIIAVIIIIYALMAILAIPMYAYKGELYQKDVSYNLDDVKSVKEKNSEDEDE
ncbi:MAG TPA: hypothetical protein VJY42_00380 [Candidatus Methanomethylophilaceae archaeon]|nr:hypothetical protein [Candidatus Methanomethylophilaceae archaeon]